MEIVVVVVVVYVVGVVYVAVLQPHTVFYCI